MIFLLRSSAPDDAPRRARLEAQRHLPPAQFRKLPRAHRRCGWFSWRKAMAKPRMKHNTWVVAADGGRALVMRNEGDAEFPRFAMVRTYGGADGGGRAGGENAPGASAG